MSSMEEFYLRELEFLLVRREHNPRRFNGYLNPEEVEQLMGSIGSLSDEEFLPNDDEESHEGEYSSSDSMEGTLESEVVQEATEENENIDEETESELIRHYREQMLQE